MSGCLARLFWTIVGPAALIVLGLMIGINKLALGSTADYVFGGALAACVAARFLDRPEAPASEASGDMARTSRMAYVLIVVGVAAAVYAAGHFVIPRFA